VLQIRKPDATAQAPIAATLLIQRYEEHQYDSEGGLASASIVLKYQRLGGASEFISRGSFQGRMGGYPFEVSVTGGSVMIGDESLRGIRLGSYLFNEVIVWAKQWPDLPVARIRVSSVDADERNLERRNRFYAGAGINFEWSTPEMREGFSLPMFAHELVTRPSGPEGPWSNVEAIEIAKWGAGCLREIDRLKYELEGARRSIASMNRPYLEAVNPSLGFACRTLFYALRRYIQTAVVITVVGVAIYGASR
jgi:GNAT superfamily N-acetyltransferase